MSSRKELKRLRREERQAAERARAQAAARRRRVATAGALFIAATAVVAGAIAVSSSGSSSPVLSTPAERAAAATEVAKRFEGIPQQGLRLGNPAAPVTLVEFADLKCPFCRRWARSVLPALISRYVRPGKLQLVFRAEHIVGDQNGDSERAARMALAASRQNKLWQFVDLFYLNQRDENDTYVNDAFLRTIARGVRGLDVATALEQRASRTVSRDLLQARSDLQSAGFETTPSFSIGRTGSALGRLDDNSFDASRFGKEIDQVLGA